MPLKRLTKKARRVARSLDTGFMYPRATRAANAMKRGAERKKGEIARRERELRMGVPPDEIVVGTPKAEGRWREPTLHNITFYPEEVLPPHPDDRRWIGHWRESTEGPSMAQSLSNWGRDRERERKQLKESQLPRPLRGFWHGAGDEDQIDLQRRIYGRTSKPRRPIPESEWEIKPKHTMGGKGKAMGAKRKKNSRTGGYVGHDKLRQSDLDDIK